MKKTLVFPLMLCLCAVAASAVPPGSSSQTVISFYASIDAGDFDKAAALLSDDLKAYIPFSPVALDKMGYKQLGMGMKAGFPDMKHEVLEVSEGKGSVAFKAMFKGTNTASLQGNPPTGNRVETSFLGFFKLNDKGLITEVTLQFDVAGFNAQLMKGIDPGAAAEATIRNMLAAADAGDADKFMSFWVDNGLNYFAGKPTGQNDMKARVAAFKSSFPDIRRVLDEVVVSGNTVVVKGWVTGTNKGTFMGNAPTGNAIKVSWLGFYKLNAAGKVTEGWVEFDTEMLKNQVNGVIASMK